MASERRAVRLFCCLSTAIGLCGPAMADPLGLYFGAGAGRAHLRAKGVTVPDDLVATPTRSIHVSAQDTGWRVFAGVRPISWVGAEFGYVDFGKVVASPPPVGFGLGYSATMQARAETASGLFYAPLPVPFLDLYARGGSRI